MPENSCDDQLRRRMKARLDGCVDPYERLGVATDYLRAKARRAARRRTAAADAVVLVVAEQVWRHAAGLEESA